MSAAPVYLVMCSTGDGFTFSVDILVAAYSSKDEADYHALQAQEANDRLVVQGVWKQENEWDPGEDPSDINEYRVDACNVYDTAADWLKDATKT